MNAIIFDIDGTLVDSMKFDSNLYIIAVKEAIPGVLIHDDWGKYANVTDAGILNQVISENNISNAIEITSRVRTRFGELIKDRLESNPCKPVLGAIEAVDELCKNKNYAIGFATGGWRHTALMKLQSAGFTIDKTTLFSSDDHHERAGIMNCCKNSISPNSADVVYIGDAEWDVKAAVKLKWGFIGIGQRLKGKTDVWIEDFTSESWKSAPQKALQMAR